MSDTFQCGDNTALVGYLYDECEPAERAAIDAHVDVVRRLRGGARGARSRRACSLRPGRRPRRTWASRSSGLEATAQAQDEPGLSPAGPRGLQAWALVPPAAARVGAGGCGVPDLWRRAVARRRARQHRRARLRRRSRVRRANVASPATRSTAPISRRSSSACARRWRELRARAGGTPLPRAAGERRADPGAGARADRRKRTAAAARAGAAHGAGRQGLRFAAHAWTWRRSSAASARSKG